MGAAVADFPAASGVEPADSRRRVRRPRQVSGAGIPAGHPAGGSGLRLPAGQGKADRPCTAPQRETILATSLSQDRESRDGI